MAGDLATAFAAERAIVRRAITGGARDIDGGCVVRHPALPDVWHLNRVHLVGGRGRVDRSWLEALVTRELDGVPHRRVTLDDESAADAVWPALEDRGWWRERSVVMVRAGHPGGRPRRVQDASAGVATRVVDATTLGAFQRLAFADDAGASARAAELPERLAETQAVLRGGTEWRAFGAGTSAGGTPASTATLYLDPDAGGRRVAFIDQVATLRAHRERGLARAVMAAALRAAGEWHADLVALFADAEDWPQVFYASLGFETVGRQTVFHRDA